MACEKLAEHVGDLRKIFGRWGPGFGVVEGRTGYYQMEMARTITALRIRIIIINTYLKLGIRNEQR